MPKVKKQKTVLAKSPPVKPARSAHQPQKQVSQHIQRPLQTGKCSSVIDQQSAEAVAKLLAAAETRTSGATIKSLTLAPHIVHKKPTFAVTCETLKHLPLIQQLITEVGLLAQHGDQLTPAVAYVSTYELLFGQGFRAKGPAERAVLQQAEPLQSALHFLLQQTGASDAAAWLEQQHQHSNHHQQQQQQGGVIRHPRYARVNTLKASVAAVLAQLQQQYGVSVGDHSTAAADATSAADRSSNGIGTITSSSSSSSKSNGMHKALRKSAAAAAAVKQRTSLQQQQQQQQQQGVHVDDLLPDVLVFPPGTDLHDHPLVHQGVLILQSKASCMPAHALNPQPGWHVVDCCAAPGNKTTHVAALLHAANSSSNSAAPDDGAGGHSLQKKFKSGKKRDRGDTIQAPAVDVKVYAFDKDPKRLQRLQANVNKTGAQEIVTVTQADFLTIHPGAEPYSKVQGVILDPSCSGSGTIISRMDHLLPKPMSASANPQNNKSSTPEEDPDLQRVEQLAKFQEAAVLHALKFPALKRLVYSTCSIHQRENEDVVSRVLPVAEQLGFRLFDPFPRWHRRGLPVVEGSEKLVRVDPYMDGTDGFFVAVFQRC